jgi:hypothetical protein
MRADRRPFEQDWEEIGRLALPNRVDIQKPGYNRAKRRANTATHDSSGASRTAPGQRHGDRAHIGSRPWFG